MARETGPVTDANHPKDPDAPEGVNEIRDNIERTRSQMSGTIEALQEKLAPAVLKERLKEGLSEAKEVVKTELAEAKEAVKVELAEAEEAVKARFVEAKEAVKVELVEAKDALSHEVSEQYHHARDVVHDATIGRVQDIARTAGDTMTQAKTTIVDTIRANPIPAALAGIGLAWLFMNRRTATTAASQQLPQYGGVGGGVPQRSVMGYATRVQNVASDTMHEVGNRASSVASAARHEASHLAQGAGQIMHDARDQADHVLHRAGEIAGQVQGQAGHLVHQAQDQVSHLANQAQHQVSHLAHQAQDQMGQLAQNARGTARRAEATIGSTFQENPLALGAVALALGTAVGLALPKTRMEDELLGETRDGFLERANEVAHEMVGKAQGVAEQLMTGETEGGTKAEPLKASADGTDKDGNKGEAKAEGNGNGNGNKAEGNDEASKAGAQRTGEGARRALS